MGCCSGRAAPPASDTEPKPHGEAGFPSTDSTAATAAAPNTTAAAPASTTAAPAYAGTSDGTRPSSSSTASADGKEGGGAGVSGTPKAPSRRGSVLKREHDKVWSDYFADAIIVADIAASLNNSVSASSAGSAASSAAAAAQAAAAGAGPRNAASRASARKSVMDIVGREQVAMRSALHERLGAIFDSYDRNHSGDLDEPELRQVLEDYLSEAKAQMTRLADTLFAPKGELRGVLVAAYTADGKTTAEAESAVDAQWEALKAAFAQKSRLQIERMDAVRAASAEFAKQLLGDLDRNQDNHVSRGEFMNSFQDRVEAIVA